MSRRARSGIMLTLLALAVGFAAITTTLFINGTLSVGTDGVGFDTDVIFTEAETSGDAFISSDGKSITFDAELMDIGQEQNLQYEIYNKNRQYDATGAIVCEFVDETNKYNDYITITTLPEDFEIEAGQRKTGDVTVRMIKSFVGNETNNYANVEFKCTIKMEATERNVLVDEEITE